MKIDELRQGMIGLSGGNSFIQKAIRFFTKSDYSHSFPIINGPLKVISSFETTSTIVTTNPICNKLQEPDYIDIWDVNATEDEKEAALKELYLEYAECWYGYLSYIWFMYRWACRKFGYEPLVVWAWAAHGVTCTELTCYYLMKLNRKFAKLFENKDFSAQSPEELVEIMKANEKLFLYRGRLKG